MVPNHGFTARILEILTEEFGDLGPQLLEQSSLLQYLNNKTKSANRGSKSRGSFGNLYAIYVLVEDYCNNGFLEREDYAEYEGARFSDLFRRQRELPFGAKLQNHALNQRLNLEFGKYFPTVETPPIIRDQGAQRYWVNEHLLSVQVGDGTVNVAPAILRIVDAYVEARTGAFEEFIADCERLRGLALNDPEAVVDFIHSLLRPNVDARIFEVVSYAILQPYYEREAVYLGWTADDVSRETLTLYKTGRTNANDGGIDFVLQPLGRFFQVTETVDVSKYFLDIEKIHRYPITFVIKSEEGVEELRARLEAAAKRRFPVDRIVARYMDAVEELINIPELQARVEVLRQAGLLHAVMDQLVRHSKLEFGFYDGD